MTETMTTPDELRREAQQLARAIDLVPLSLATRAAAKRLGKSLANAALPHTVEQHLVSALHEDLFTLTHRANLGSGPLRESARRIRGLVEAIVPVEPDDINDGSPVLTPDEAARYLGLAKLGVSNPAARVRYLVKHQKLRAIKILGRAAFQRSDLDQYLILHASSGRK